MITALEKKIAAWQSEYRIDGNSLAFYRIFFCIIFAVFLIPSFAWIGDVPKAFFDPPMLSFASLFPTFPSKSFFLFLDVVIRVSLVLIAVGFFTRVSTGALLAALLVGNNFQYSFGKIDHSIFLLCVLFVMLIINWGQSLSIDQMLFKRPKMSSSPEPASSHRNVSSIWLLAVFLAFGFFSAGFGKALVWIDFDFNTNGFLAWLYRGYYGIGRQELLAPTVIGIRPLWIFEFADIVAVVFELGCMIAIFRRRTFMIWLLVACLFHLSNCLILNITFRYYSICYLAFVPWSKLIPRLATLDRLPLWSWVAIGTAIILIGPQFNILSFLNSPSWRLELGVLLWTFAAIILAVTLWKTRSVRLGGPQGDVSES